MPDHDRRLIVVYDGSCAFCTVAADRLRRHDRRAALRLVPIADTVEAHGQVLQRQELDREMHVVDHRGGIHRGFRAW